MLARRLLLSLGLILATMVLPLPALADSGGAFVNEDTVIVRIETSGSPGSAATVRRERAQSGSPASGCQTSGGALIPCYQFGVSWRPDLQCYARVKPIQPPITDVIWEGNTTGMIVECRIGTEGGWNTGWDTWVGTSALPEPPDPEELARRAVARMQLQPIRMGTFPQVEQRSPAALGYVGWNVWMWVDGASDSTWGPITRSVSDRGFTVTATARVDRVDWNMGDGTIVECEIGKPWQSIWTHNEASPDCGHLYVKDGEYNVTATSYWVIDWAGIGESGVLTMALDTTGTIRIAEVQVVNVNGP